MVDVSDRKKNPKIKGQLAHLSNSGVPSGVPLRYLALPATTGKGEREVPTQARRVLGFLSRINRGDSENRSMRGAQIPGPGAPAHPSSACALRLQSPHLNLWEGNPLGPGTFPKQVTAPLGPGSLPGLRASSLPGSRGFVYFSVRPHSCFHPAHRRECFKENLSY